MDAKKYARSLEFGQERRFRELGVAVVVHEARDGRPGYIEVRALEPRERFARRRDLTRHTHRQ